MEAPPLSRTPLLSYKSESYPDGEPSVTITAPAMQNAFRPRVRSQFATGLARVTLGQTGKDLINVETTWLSECHKSAGWQGD